MKKFVLFQYSQYYPSGGMSDIEGSFDTLQEALDFIKVHWRDFNEVVDRDTWEIVWNR